jgi:hypothetical protein
LLSLGIFGETDTDVLLPFLGDVGGGWHDLAPRKNGYDCKGKMKLFPFS